ncbi:MAG: diadenylate cyclase CdaA [Ignavibacteriaceae bacterium]|nr:diadenylate cyclase CdaA [Ignavibacteriaceae bacterium]
MFDIFKIGFLTITFIDVIDIALVSFIVYKLYTLLRGTIAAQIFVGLMIILLISFLSQAANLRAVSWLLKLLTDIWVIAFIILFQPEIRRLLVLLARNPFLKPFIKSDAPTATDIVAEAAFELAQQQHGALIVLITSAGIRGYAETGEPLNARLNKSLLTSIFYPRSPLHDGAVIIKDNIIEAARCTLPLSAHTKIDGESLGMRHRAGLGITEVADVLSVIVSEETGQISIAENGQLTTGLSKEALKKRLSETFKPPAIKGWKGLFEQYRKNK